MVEEGEPLNIRRRRRTNPTRPSRFSSQQENIIKLNLKEFDWTDLKWTEEVCGCPVYEPSEDEFADPLFYLRSIAPEASKYGICKIVSPMKPSVSAASVLKGERQGFRFSTYVQSLRTPEWKANDKGTFSISQRNYTYSSFSRMANKFFDLQFPRCGGLPPTYLEKKFWHEMSHGQRCCVEYGVNVEGSGFSMDPTCPLGTSLWNLKVLPILPESILRLLQAPIPGISDPMLYIGMVFSIFAWHVEDHYLYSINYHHCGAPKTWYGVPGWAASGFERIAFKHVYDSEILCTNDENGAFKELAGKTTMFSPKLLLEKKVPVYKAVQNPGEFVITFPRAYHAGFSNGFNCGEAVNFAVHDWFPYGDLSFRRYANLKMKVIIPYEELIVKEALIIHRDGRNNVADLVSQSFVKDTFLEHIQSLNDGIRRLSDLKAAFIRSPTSQGSVFCTVCNRDCYLAYIQCQSNSCRKQMCIFHRIRSIQCSCKSDRVVFVREDEIHNAENAAQKFEEERIVPEEVQQERNTSNYSITLSRITDGLAKTEESLARQMTAPRIERRR